MTILESLRAATRPDRELDADILEAMGGCAHKETEYYCIEDGNDCDSGFTCKKCGTDTYGAKIERYTASIDAALALVERMLPGCGVVIHANNDSYMKDSAIIHVPSYSSPPKCDGLGATPALAILAALFAALEAKETVK